MRELDALCTKRGLKVTELSPGHFRITGGSSIVDYWPSSKKRTAFIVGTNNSRRFVTPKEAVEMAFLPLPEGFRPIPAAPVAEAPRKRTVADWISLLPHLRFAWSRKERKQCE